MLLELLGESGGVRLDRLRDAVLGAMLGIDEGPDRLAIGRVRDHARREDDEVRL